VAAKRLSLRAVLTSLAVDIVEAESGHDAIRLVHDQQFAVILLDVRMPIMNGIETAAFIRRNRTSHDTPIIFVTGYETAARYPIEPCEISTSEYMLLPVKPAELRQRVTALMDQFLASDACCASREASPVDQ